MKNLLFSMLLVSLISSFSTHTGQEIVKAFKSGNAASVAQYFDNTVEISLPAKSSSYSKKQATLVLQDFFASNEIKDFQVLHQLIQELRFEK
jgi:hypothetical protein